MPLLKFDSPVNRISGRLGTAPSTFTWNNGAPVLRDQPTVTNPDTTDQQAIRGIFALVTKNWKLLTQVQRDGWLLFAQNNNVTNRLGNPVGRNGISAYVELASMHYVRTGALLAAAPVLPRPAPATSVTLNSITQTAGNNLTFDMPSGYTTVTGLYVVARATPGTLYESQVPKVSDYRLIEGVTTNSITALILPTSSTQYTWNPTKYAYADNQWVGVEVSIMNAEGWQSIPVRSFTVFDV